MELHISSGAYQSRPSGIESVHIDLRAGIKDIYEWYLNDSAVLQ
jgi:hypothetical protein